MDERKEGESTPKSTGNAGKGRPKGSKNKTTTALKEAILLAAANSGKKLRPETDDGLVGYLEFLADDEPKAFAPLLGRVLPMEVNSEGGAAIIVEVVKGVDDAD